MTEIQAMMQAITQAAIKAAKAAVRVMTQAADLAENSTGKNAADPKKADHKWGANAQLASTKQIWWTKQLQNGG